MDEALKAEHFYVAIAPGECYKCREPIDVIALILPIPFDGVVSEDPEDQFSLVSWVQDINDEALEVIQPVAPLWRLGKSHTLEEEVFMNHCASCDAHQGDFFLHKPDGPFSPCTKRTRKKFD